MEYFRRLGAVLDRAWRAVGRDEERFPDVAVAALAELPPAEHFDREAVMDALLDPRTPAMRQLAPLGAFGQPGITVHHGDGFVVELYYWLNSSSAVHNHPFCGAFTIVEGYSVHARYSVVERERMGSCAALADVSLAELRLLEAGHVERFSLRDHPLVHALIHVPVPSISMVVRTIRTLGYQRYLPPTIVIPMEAPSEPAARRLALLGALGAGGDPLYPQRLARELGNADFETGVRIISDGWAGWQPDTRAALLDLLRVRHGAAVDAIPPALERAARVADVTAIRERLRDADLRLVATALGYAETRERVLDLLSARGDPLTLLHRFVDEAEVVVVTDDDTTAVIAHALVDGEGSEGALRRLAAVHGADAVAPHEADVSDFCESSIFSVLLAT